MSHDEVFVRITRLPSTRVAVDRTVVSLEPPQHAHTAGITSCFADTSILTLPRSGIYHAAMHQRAVTRHLCVVALSRRDPRYDDLRR